MKTGPSNELTGWGSADDSAGCGFGCEQKRAIVAPSEKCSNAGLAQLDVVVVGNVRQCATVEQNAA